MHYVFIRALSAALKVDSPVRCMLVKIHRTHSFAQVRSQVVVAELA